MSRARLIVLVMLLATPVASAQQTSVSIRGRVVAAEDNRALRRALVSLARPDRRVRPVLTDEEGRFEITLSDIASELVIAKAGYAYTRVTPDRRAEPSREIEIRLSRGAVLSGRLLDPDGEPATGARIVARRDEGAASAGPTYETEADDRGEYRIGGLPAGQYSLSTRTGPQVIRTLTGDGRPVTQVIIAPPGTNLVVPPGTRDLGLAVPTAGTVRAIEARAGEETGSVDFQTAPMSLNALTGSPSSVANPGLANNPFSGIIRGRVVTPAGVPVSGAVLQLRGTSGLRTMVANSSGRFEVGSLSDDDYVIVASPSGPAGPVPVLSTELGAARTFVRVRGEKRIHDVELVLARGGAISGTVVDSGGEPFQGVLVRALRLRREGGRTVASVAAWSRLTDDRGRYRLFGLQAGAYLIVTSLDAAEPARGPSRATGFAPVYYPGTAHVDAAQPVELAMGDEVAGADLTFAVSPAARVTGTAVRANGEPVVGRVSLVESRRSGAVASEPRVAQVESDGSFELNDVPPGDYIVQATSEGQFGAPREFGAEYLTVTERNAPPVHVKTSAGATLDGRFVVEGMSEPPMRALSIHADPIDADRSPAPGRGPEGLVVHDNGMFYLTGLLGPMRLTLPNPMPGWYLKSVTIGGVDVTDTAFDFGYAEETFPNAEIILSNSGGAITGSVSESSNSPVTTVIAFSTDRTNWFAGSRHIRQSFADTDGSFDVRGLPPGEYYVAAIDRSGAEDPQSPDVLESLVSRAERLRVRDGQVLKARLSINRR